MKTALLAFIFSLIMLHGAKAQPNFDINLTPTQQTVIQGQTVEFAINVIPKNGYNASVNFSVQDGECFTNAITFQPTSLNSPYIDGKIKIVTSANVKPGIHTIVIKGQNGPASSVDTIYIDVKPGKFSWITYNIYNSGLQCDGLAAVAVDQNGTKWVGSKPIYSNGCSKFNREDCLSSYNDSIWKVYYRDSLFTYDYCGSLIEAKKTGFNFYSEYTVIEVDSANNVWAGTWDGGLFKITQEGIITQYNTTTSGIPGNRIRSIKFFKGKLWAGTDAGIGIFDGSAWTKMNTSNSGLPRNLINDIDFDSKGNMYVTTGDLYGGDFVRFDGTFWSVYNIDNSDLSSDICKVIVDKNDNVWFGDGYNRSIVRFDGTTFNKFVFSTATGPMLKDFTIDKEGLVWAGFNGYYIQSAAAPGLAYFNGSKWISYNTANSEFPKVIGNCGSEKSDNSVQQIAFDSNNDAWIATGGAGLAFFKRSSLNTGLEEMKVQSDLLLYPNPSYGYITVSIKQSSSFSIFVYNIFGNEVSFQQYTMDNGIRVDLTNLPKGTYLIRVLDGEQNLTKKVILE